MRITNVEAIALETPATTDAALDAVIVRVDTDEGIYGIGEAAAAPAVVRAIVETRSYHTWSMGLRELLVGRDPEHTERLWELMYEHTAMNGRRGLIVNVIGAVDVALWDIRGKAAGKPIHHLLGGACRDAIDAYLTIDPDVPDAAEWERQSLALIERARSLGFRAVKQEAALERVPDEQDVSRLVRQAREAAGDALLMLDVVYRWRDVKTALHTLTRCADADLFFVEAPFSNDDLSSYARLAGSSATRIAAGEWRTTRFEFLDLMDQGLCDVVQPGISRVGGFTEAMRVARLAADRGRLVTPYGWWATGIGLAANLQYAAVVPNCPFVEYIHPELYPSEIRDRVVGPTPVADGGRFALPLASGLGVELDADAIEHYRIR